MKGEIARITHPHWLELFVFERSLVIRAVSTHNTTTSMAVVAPDNQCEGGGASLTHGDLVVRNKYWGRVS